MIRRVDGSGLLRMVVVKMRTQKNGYALFKDLAISTQIIFLLLFKCVIWVSERVIDW